MTKYFLIIFFLVFSFAPINIYAQTSVAPTSDIQNIKDLVVAKTPVFIAKPVTYVVNKIEEFRLNTGAWAEVKKVTVQAEIDALNADQDSIKAKIGASEIVKPIKYLKLYLFAIIAFIFNITLVFYGILGVIILYIARFTLRLIF